MAQTSYSTNTWQKPNKLTSQNCFLILHQQLSIPRGLLPGMDTNLCSSFLRRVISLHSWISSILQRHGGTKETHKHLLALHMLHVDEECDLDSTIRENEIQTKRAWVWSFTLEKTQSSLSRNRCDVPDSLRSASVCITFFLFQWPFKSVDHYWHWGGVQDSLHLPHLT